MWRFGFKAWLNLIVPCHHLLRRQHYTECSKGTYSSKSLNWLHWLHWLVDAYICTPLHVVARRCTLLHSVELASIQTRVGISCTIQNTWEILYTPKTAKTASQRNICRSLVTIWRLVENCTIWSSISGAQCVPEWHVSCFMLHVACWVLHVTCCILGVACCMLHVACCMWRGWGQRYLRDPSA